LHDFYLKTSFPQHLLLRQESIWVFVIPANAGIHRDHTGYPLEFTLAQAGVGMTHNTSKLSLRSTYLNATCSSCMNYAGKARMDETALLVTYHFVTCHW
jgi:hypothetical protein